MYSSRFGVELFYVDCITLDKFDERLEFENRRTEHIYALIHIVEAPKTDDNEDNEIIEFIDKQIASLTY